MDYQSYTTTELVALANAFAQMDELAGDPAMPADLPALLAEHMALNAEGRAAQLAELSRVANVATVADGVENPLDLVTPLLTDEQAEQVPNAYPEWEEGMAYKVGDRRRYEGKLYRCVQAHTSQEGWEPDKVPALWVRTSQEGEIPDWVQPTGAHDAYAKGDKVRHGGKVWESTMDANIWEPGAVGTETLWVEA
jgi:chitodextrinase